jgi:hypothetical protein
VHKTRSAVFAMMAALAAVPVSARAASLRVGTPALVAPGWTRIAGHYAGLDGITAEPVFRAIARCRDHTADARILDGVVQHVDAGDGAVWLDVPGTPDRLAPSTPACAAPELAVEMLVGPDVVASAPVATNETATTFVPVEPPPVARAQRKVALKGGKYGAGGADKRTEAGVEWALDSRVSLQLNYERTSQSPMMPFDHDNGILTRVRIGF